MKDLTIDVYMDTICPWCRMGTTSLRTALKQLPAGTKATVRWHAYQLNPGIRPEGEDYRQIMIGRLGGTAQFEARMRQYNETGAHIGDVDELVQIARASGVTDDAAELKTRLNQGEGLEKVGIGQRNAQKMGIRGVPYFVINEEISLSGLQSPNEFMKVFENS
ncbi:DsbA family protein [Cohnella sp.]|uniref:DsbA family protein n=1 Tax=Cohnella sp. TaxID=1883426 RepID=UPI003561916D